jgi:hypothetical protein
MALGPVSIQWKTSFCGCIWTDLSEHYEENGARFRLVRKSSNYLNYFIKLSSIVFNKYMVGVSDDLVHKEAIILVNISYHLDRGGL